MKPALLGLLSGWKWFVGLASHEWLLTRNKLPNGGDVILLRSLLVATQTYAFLLGLKNALDPEALWAFSWSGLVTDLRSTGYWFGTIFAGVYASLYARYSSQWTYLANVYNRIKETEARGIPVGAAAQALVEWKAGFIEDADDLHLLAKPMFFSVVRAWATEDVERVFEEHTINGAERWRDILNRVRK
jgi:hypothetical protein